MSSKPHRRLTESLARRAVAQLVGRIAGGTVELVDPSGTEWFGDRRPVAGEDPIDVRVTVHDPRLYPRLLREGSVGLGESYADGWWDTDDLAGFLRLAHRNLSRTHALRDRIHHVASPILDPIARRRAVDQERDRANVRAHYDLGNELFQRMLDETMMYSCAVFESPQDSLTTASRAKLDRLARILELAPGDRVLEIGSGWGGFAVHAARNYGCRVTTTTISAEQYEYTRRRVHEAGLDHQVTVLPDDYRDLEGSFDKVVAIEMIEAVDWREYEQFFAHVRRLLSDTGLLAMQAIVIPDRSFDRAKHRTDFIKAAIFPGGCLPSVGALTEAAGASDLAGVHLDDIGVHYAETLRRWRANLTEHRDELGSIGLDARFARLWDFYFSYCEAGFDERYISVVQLAFAPPGRKRTAPRTHAQPVRHLSMV